MKKEVLWLGLSSRDSHEREFKKGEQPHFTPGVIEPFGRCLTELGKVLKGRTGGSTGESTPDESSFNQIIVVEIKLGYLDITDHEAESH